MNILSASTHARTATSVQTVSVKRDHIEDYLRIPGFKQVLSHGDKPLLPLAPAQHNTLIALGMEGKYFFVICLEAEFRSAAWFNLIEQGKRTHMVFTGAYTCSPDVLQTLLQEHVLDKTATQAQKALEHEQETISKIIQDSAPLGWLNGIVAHCLQLGSSDIHFEVRGDITLLRVRRDGLMRLVKHLPSRMVISGLSAGYTVLSQEGSSSEVAFNAGLPQSAMIPMDVHGQKLQLRYQSHPSVSGFDVTIRILRTGKVNHQDLPQIEKLGYTPWQVEQLRETTQSAWGGVFIAGITGSGKTTTLSALLSMLASQGQRKIISIEDPVEYVVPGVSHFSIQRQAKGSTHNPFEAAMMAFLRMDPDVGMFGEIRDRISAQMAHSAIQTGHKLLTTVHATSALGIVARLTSQNLGLLREDVCNAEFLSLLAYQVLMPLNCPHCKVRAISVMPVKALVEYEKYFALDVADLRCASDTGCSHCQVPGIEAIPNSHAGVKGVKVCAEVLALDNTMLNMLHQGDDIGARNHWLGLRRAGFDQEDMLGKEAWGHALYDMSQGRIDPYHFERTFGAPSVIARTRQLQPMVGGA
jgi:type II secretory ATPase GspE/PulE/Tfp pilus assembly ATPase PilB-like protein